MQPKETTAKPVDVSRHGGDLIALRDLLQALIRLQTELQDAIDLQLGAMRTADVNAMQAAAGRVNELTARFEHLELQRQSVVARLSDATGTDAADPRLSELVAELPDRWRGEFAALAGALRDRMLAVAAANRVAQTVCREMCEHFRAVFETVALAAAPGAGYERTGRVQPGDLGVLNAVG